MGLVLGLRLICRVFMFCAEEIYLGLSRFAPVFETLRHEGTKGHKVDYYDFLIVLFFIISSIPTSCPFVPSCLCGLKKCERSELSQHLETILHH